MQVEAPLFLDKTAAGRAEKCVFFQTSPLPQGLDDQATSFSEGLDPPVNIKYCYIAGILSSTACGLIGYFKVTWW